MIDFAKLREPFPAEDIEWRIAQKGKTNDGKPWAKVLAYVTNRAIMQRLDDVCGPENWRNEFQHIQGAFLCGLSVKVDGEWITKWDGAQESQIEATKGGISGAMKRAAVQWGIGRYLYDLEEGWAVISDRGKTYVPAKDGVPAFKWDPPQLPAWALPEQKPRQPVNRPAETPHLPPKLPLEEVFRELDAAMDESDLKAIFTRRYSMVKAHYSKGDLDKYEAKKDEIKAKFAAFEAQP